MTEGLLTILKIIHTSAFRISKVPLDTKNKGEKMYLHEHLEADSLYNIRNSQIK